MSTNNRATAPIGAPRAAPGATVWTDLGPRILLVLFAAGAGALGAPWPIASPLVAAAGMLTVERCVRRRGRGWLDTVAVGVGGALAVVILMGILLNVLPGGLTRRSWAAGLALAGITALLICRHEGPRAPSPVSRRPRPFNAVLYALTAVLVVFAMVVSVLSAGEKRGPDLQLAVQQQATSDASPWVSVIVSSSTAYGPLQLLLDEGREPRTWGGLFEVAADRPYLVSVPVPAGARVTVSLAEAGDPSPLRRVTIDRSHPVPAADAHVGAP